MLNSLCRSSPSNALPGIIAAEKGDADGMLVASRLGEKVSNGRDVVGDDGEGAMISRRSSSIALSLTDVAVGSSAAVVADDEGVMLSSVI